MPSNLFLNPLQSSVISSNQSFTQQKQKKTFNELRYPKKRTKEKLMIKVAIRIKGKNVNNRVIHFMTLEIFQSLNNKRDKHTHTNNIVIENKHLAIPLPWELLYSLIHFISHSRVLLNERVRKSLILHFTSFPYLIFWGC